MNYKGIVIKESLENTSSLEEVKILETKVEKTTIEHQTPWIKQWTLFTVQVAEDKADAIAEKLSKDLEKEHGWYADYKNDKYHYIIFRGKVFKVDLKNPILYQDAKQYGLSIGIPEYQVDFVPEDKVWER